MRRALALWLVTGCGPGSSPNDPDAGEPDASVGPDSGQPDSGLDASTPPYWTDEFPTPVPGNCEALPVSEEASWPAGATPEGAKPAGFILPGGRRITPAGTLTRVEGFPIDMVELANDRLLVTDSSKIEHRLHLVDAATGAVLDVAGQDRGIEGLFHGLAVATDGVSGFAAGGGGGSSGLPQIGGGGDSGDPVYPFRVEDDAIVLGEPIWLDGGYPSGLALSADGGTLLAALELGDALALIDTESGDEVSRIHLGDSVHPYGVVLSQDGETAYVSLWAGDAVAIVSLESGTVTGSIAVDKNPGSMLITPDGGRLFVVNSDSDTLGVIDLGTAELIETVFLGAWPDAPFGAAPNNLALSADGTRLYVTASGENAVEVLDPETFDRIGRIPTAWYPTAVHPRPDGSLVVLTSKGIGSGPQRDVRDVYPLMAGSVSVVEPLDDDTLAAGVARVDENNTRMRDVHAVECDGAPYDFPIPSGPDQTSPIKRVVLIVRENKTYDSELGDLEGTNADPDLVLWREDETTPNLHALARAFANTDNFYSQAEQSVQGHLWTTTVATTDFAEKTWLQDNRGIPIVGLEPYATPAKGFFLEHVLDGGFDVVAWAEMLGRTFRSTPYYDPNLPGNGMWNLAVPDRDRAEYIAERVLWEGFLPHYTYMSIHRNHTAGDSPGMETPHSMVADNDEATGMIVEAISHSVFWPETAIFIFEDDPQDGYDHVDGHRTICLVVSPWAKRGVTSHLHYDDASVYRTVELILGLEPMSRYDADAAPLYDLFTSTPDYTPFETLPRTWPVEWNPEEDEANARGGDGRPGDFGRDANDERSESERAEADSFRRSERGVRGGRRPTRGDEREGRRIDLSAPDQTGGLGPLLWRMVRGGSPPPYAKIIPGWADPDD